jgi:hypothetical protein
VSLKTLIRSDVSDVFLDTDDFAEECAYDGRAMNMLKSEQGSQQYQGRDLLSQADAIARGADFRASLADITGDDPTYVPQPGVEIQWTDENNQPHIFVVFPRVGEQCYEYLDGYRAMVRLYAVAQESLQPLVVTIANGTMPFTVSAVPTVIRGAEDFTDSRSEVRILTAAAYVARSDMTAQNVNTPPPAATFDFLGLEGWAIDMNRTEWGPGLVKIGLMRETLVREWQARRNAAV